MKAYFYNYLETPIGLLEIQVSDTALCAINFVDEKTHNEVFTSVGDTVKGQLMEYFSGKRKTFSLPLEIKGTPFQQKVYQGLMEIPYGKTLSYGELALKIGHEKASRAVGGANHCNAIPIVIPCHRVIGKNGKMVGYAGELWRKERLLEMELSFSLV